MRLGDEAVSSMYRAINSMKKELGIKGKHSVFKYECPETYNNGEAYIVINFLPFVHNKVVSEGDVNVNVHVPQTSEKEPDGVKLAKITRGIAEYFSDAVYMDGFYFEFYADSRPVKDSDGTYYVNLKFKVTYNDLKD